MIDFETTFPQRYVLNLARRQDRRAGVEQLFWEHGLEVRRFPAVDARWVKKSRGFENPGRYAHAVTTRLAIRRAMLAGAEAVFLFEDDVVLHPDWRERLAELDLPEDWGIFYLGCQHHERPEVVQPGSAAGLVRVRGALDTHAWGIRAPYFRQVMAALRRRDKTTDPFHPPADVTLARLHASIPTYAVYPNVAWQEENHSDLLKGTYSTYLPDGIQKPAPYALTGLLAECLGGHAYAPEKEASAGKRAWFRFGPMPSLAEAARRRAGRPAAAGAIENSGEQSNEPVMGPPPGKTAFLFLTIGAHRHPALWSDYWRGHESDVSIYGHSKCAEHLCDGWLKTAQIAEKVQTQWGDISLVRAHLALLRAALMDEGNSHFVLLSDSCVPVRPYADLRRLLTLDSRSRFAWESAESLREKLPLKAARSHQGPTLPGSMWRFHPQWLLLDREAADLLVEDDFTEHFGAVECPDECYAGTVFNLKGYSLEEHVARHNVTWSRWNRPQSPHPDEIAVVDGLLAAEWLSSGTFFARKVATEAAIGQWRLHCG